MSNNADVREFRLKSTTASNVGYNVMILGGGAAIRNFTPPVRLIRSAPPAAVAESDKDQQQQQQNDQIGRGKRKRTRILQLEDEEETALREQESHPWALEDFDGQHALLGRLEGGQQSNYVFFVNHGNEFHVLPASRWYRFQPRLAFQPLSLEEAEEQMGHGSDPDRWLMHQRNDEKNPLWRIEERLNNNNSNRNRNNEKKKEQKTSADTEEEEDFDEENFFDDDDEGVTTTATATAAASDPHHNDDPTRPVPVRAGRDAQSMPKLSKEGQRIRRVLRKGSRRRDREDLDNDDEDEEDEEEDPYADEVEEVEQDDLIKEESSKLPLQRPTAVNPAIIKRPPTSLSNPKPSPSKSGNSSSGTSTAKPSRSVSPSPSKRAREDEEQHPLSITDADVIAELRKTGPISTRDLINRFRAHFKADPANRSLFREAVKRVAMVIVLATDEERMLQLKPEYIQ